jgi:hypothetical protein
MPDLSEYAQRMSTPELLFLAGVVLAVMAMMRIARLRAMRREPELKLVNREQILAQLRPPVETEYLPPPRPAAAAPPTAALEEMLRRLDNRVKTLEELLRAADRRIVELNALLHREREAPREVVPLAHHQAESLARERELSNPARGGERHDSGRLAARYQAVYQLLDQGESAANVARALGYPVGEVELIAGLRG